MRKSFVSAFLFAAAGCSSHHGTSPATQDDVASGPAVTPTAAPGVAFNYRYAFRLPGERIGSIQEEHASACEKLGIARCRITGMVYRVTDRSDVDARLDFKLDPAIARAFGKQGIDAVVHADGLLVESEISGEDAGGAIAAANRSEAQQGEELGRIQGQLARTGLGAEERAQLRSQAQQLGESIRSSRDGKAQQQESLARTPVSFSYVSGDMAPGFRRSLRDAAGNFVFGLEWIAVALISLLPWLLVALAGWWVVRWIRRRFPSPLALEG